MLNKYNKRKKELLIQTDSVNNKQNKIKYKK